MTQLISLLKDMKPWMDSSSLTSSPYDDLNNRLFMYYVIADLLNTDKALTNDSVSRETEIEFLKDMEGHMNGVYSKYFSNDPKIAKPWTAELARRIGLHIVNNEEEYTDLSRILEYHRRNDLSVR